ncbi:co-chaperone HscB [Enterobacteriaceae bacterium LUAb1]
MDYFTLFDLPQSWELDKAALNTRFQKLQRQFHPDRFATAAEAERLQAVQQAANINQAYQTLRSPLTRAEYLLSLHGIDINNEQLTMHDNAFLTEQLEWREELETLEQTRDEGGLARFMCRLEPILAEYQKQLGNELAGYQWALAADTARKLRFLAKLRCQAEELEERLLDF